MMLVLKNFFTEFLAFGLKEVQSCVFAGSFFVLLFVSHHIPLFGLARYDFLFLASILIQLVLYLLRLETWEEIKIIFLFHILGIALELFKTHPLIGSWSYPESGFFMVYTVPLYSGFMYAAVGSYISQAWKYFGLRLEHAPHYMLSIILCVAIYLNFFTHHVLPDARWVLIVLVFLFFWRTRVYFTPLQKSRWMYLNIAFLLIAFFVWVAENISTYLGAWQYPNQVHTWALVSTGKITSWFLLIIISFIIVAYLKHYKKVINPK